MLKSIHRICATTLMIVGKFIYFVFCLKLLWLSLLCIVGDLMILLEVPEPDDAERMKFVSLILGIPQAVLAYWIFRATAPDRWTLPRWLGILARSLAIMMFVPSILNLVKYVIRHRV